MCQELFNNRNISTILTRDNLILLIDKLKEISIDITTDDILLFLKYNAEPKRYNINLSDYNIGDNVILFNLKDSKYNNIEGKIVDLDINGPDKEERHQVEYNYEKETMKRLLKPVKEVVYNVENLAAVIVDNPMKTTLQEGDKFTFDI
jgi:hypothetical protein